MLKIREYRKKKGLSQKDFSEKLGLSQNSMSQYETGTREPGVVTLVQIAEELGITVDELIDYQKIKNKLAEDLSKRVEKRIEESKRNKK